MKTVFLNIAYMKFYKGINENDTQINGSADAFDQFNFCMANIDDEEMLIGFADNAGIKGGLSLKKHKLCEECEDYAENVLAVWCAKNIDGNTVVVGWYKNATIYKDYCTCTFESDDAVCGYEQYFNVETHYCDGVLLPVDERMKPEWQISNELINSFEKSGNVWFPTNNNIIKDTVNNIEKYNGKSHA